MTDSIAKAVAVIRVSTDSDEVALYRNVVAKGLAPDLAARLVEFLPMAYCRLMLQPSGVRFSGSFRRRLPNGQITPEQPLSSEPIWDAVLAFAKAEIDRGISTENLLAVAGRSAEFDVVNQLAEKGSKLSDIVLTSIVLAWSENGLEPN
jgi:hypothetical protein